MRGAGARRGPWAGARAGDAAAAEQGRAMALRTRSACRGRARPAGAHGAGRTTPPRPAAAQQAVITPVALRPAFLLGKRLTCWASACCISLPSVIPYSLASIKRRLCILPAAEQVVIKQVTLPQSVPFSFCSRHNRLHLCLPCKSSWLSPSLLFYRGARLLTHGPVQLLCLLKVRNRL